MGELTAFARSRAAARIRAAATHGTLAHALILSGAGDRAAAARYAAAAFECAAAGEKPCLACPHCRKVMADIHPDVVFVRDPEHKELSAETVRAMRADTVVRPNEGGRKVYIFADCAALNARDQNILLKTVEEGPPYCAFLFCAENAAALLQTVRSRCVEVKLADGGADGAAEDARAAELCRLLAGGAAERAAFLVRLEGARPKREELGALFAAARSRCADALLARRGAHEAADDALAPLSDARLVRVAALLDDYRVHCTYNVNVGITLGGFAAALSEILG